MTTGKHLLFLAALGSAACGSSSEDPAGKPTGGCDEQRVALGLDEASPFGIAPSDLLPLAKGSHSAELGFDAKAQPASPLTTLTFVVDTSAATAEYVTRTARPESSSTCESSLELAVSAKFSTADGKFDETWPSLALVYKARQTPPVPDLLEANLTLEPDAIHGTYAPTYEAGWCLFDVSVVASFRHAEFSGSIIPNFISPPCDPADPKGSVVNGPGALWPPVKPEG
jgi:hypothetical protein